jgi:C_GCAxxG_C_C family probable redox protein
MVNSEAHKRELTERAFQVGFEYEKKYGGCAQCCFAALQVVLDRREPEANAAFRMLSTMAGGCASMGDGSCGAYLGAAAFIGYLAGRTRDEIADPGVEQVSDEERSARYGELCGRADAVAIKLYRQFIDKYGTVVCHSIHRKLFGRPFFTKDPEEYQKFQAAGAYDQACTSVVGDTARWTIEVLADTGLI